LKYKTRGELQQKDLKAYGAIKYRGLLDKLCSHMVKQSYSTPQLILNMLVRELLGKETVYNTRKIIKPLELDVYVPELHIAFEYDGKHWHQNNIDTKTRKCFDIGIKLFILKENSRKYEEDIKHQLSMMVDDINDWCKMHITNEDIQNATINYRELLINKVDVIEICAKYSEYEIFKKENVSLYEKLLRLKLLETFTCHMKRKRIRRTKESVKKIINEYVENNAYLGDFINEQHGVYLWCRKNNPSLLMGLKYKNKLHSIKY
jgi:hypothetical protein